MSEQQFNNPGGIILQNTLQRKAAKLAAGTSECLNGMLLDIGLQRETEIIIIVVDSFPVGYEQLHE